MATEKPSPYIMDGDKVKMTFPDGGHIWVPTGEVGEEIRHGLRPATSLNDLKSGHAKLDLASPAATEGKPATPRGRPQGPGFS